MVISVYQNIIKVYIAIVNSFQYFFSESLKAGRSVLDSERHPDELVQAPGSVYTHFQLIFFFNWYEMECLGHVNLAEHFGTFDVTLEGVEVGERVGLVKGGLVERPKVATRPLGAIRLVLKVERG